jgi:hypothetical protein
MAQEIQELAMKLTHENPTAGFDRLQGMLSKSPF